MHLEAFNLTTNSTTFHYLIKSSWLGTNAAYTMKHLSRGGREQDEKILTVNMKMQKY